MRTIVNDRSGERPVPRLDRARDFESPLEYKSALRTQSYLIL